VRGAGWKAGVALGLLALAWAGAAEAPRVPGAKDSEPPRVRAARRFLARRGWAAHSAEKQVLRFAQDDKSLRVGKSRTSAYIAPDAAGSAVWTAAGPVGVNSLSYGLVTGRVAAIALDPSDTTGNTVYLGTTGGGVWKSQNGAASPAGSVQFLPLTDQASALSGVADMRRGR
jgi:hypothetical protein